MSPSWFRVWANFQRENPSVLSDCTVQMTIPPKNRYSCLRLENKSEAVQYTKCDGMWKKINGQATQFSIPRLREPASSLWSLGKSHLLLKGLFLWHFREEKLEDSSTCWQKMLQEMILNLIYVPSNDLCLFTVFSRCLWYRALRNKKRVTTPNSSTNTQKSSCTLYTLIYTRPVSKERIQD